MYPFFFIVYIHYFCQFILYSRVHSYTYTHFSEGTVFERVRQTISNVARSFELVTSYSATVIFSRFFLAVLIVLLNKRNWWLDDFFSQETRSYFRAYFPPPKKFSIFSPSLNCSPICILVSRSTDFYYHAHPLPATRSLNRRVSTFHHVDDSIVSHNHFPEGKFRTLIHKQEEKEERRIPSGRSSG